MVSLLQSLKPEYRELVEKTRTFVEPPASLPQHMRSHMLASLNAFCEHRSITALEVQAYQTAAARFAASRPTARPIVRQRQMTVDVDQRNRERLNALTRTIVTDRYSNDLIADFELRAKADRIANVIERDDWTEKFSALRRELGE